MATSPENPLAFTPEQLARAVDAIRFEARGKYDRDQGGKFDKKDSGDKSGNKAKPEAKSRKSAGGEAAPAKNRVEKVPASVGALPGKTAESSGSLPGKTGKPASLPGKQAEPETSGSLDGKTGSDDLPDPETLDSYKEAKATMDKRAGGDADSKVSTSLLEDQLADGNKSTDLDPDVVEAQKDKAIGAEMAKLELGDADKKTLEKVGFSELDLATMSPRDFKKNVAAAKMIEAMAAFDGENPDGSPIAGDPFAVIAGVSQKEAASLGRQAAMNLKKGSKAAEKAAKNELKAQGSLEKAEQKAAKQAEALKAKHAKIAAKLGEFAAKAEAKAQRAQAKAEAKERDETIKSVKRDQAEIDKSGADREKADKRASAEVGRAETAAHKEDAKRTGDEAKRQAVLDKSFDQSMKQAGQNVKAEEKAIKQGDKAFAKIAKQEEAGKLKDQSAAIRENKSFEKSKAKMARAIAGMGKQAAKAAAQAQKSVAKQEASDEREATAENKQRDKDKATADKAAEKTHAEMGKAEGDAQREDASRAKQKDKQQAVLDKSFEQAMKHAEKTVKAEEKAAAKADKSALKEGKAIGKGLAGGIGGSLGKGLKKQKISGGISGAPAKTGRMPEIKKAATKKLSKKDANILNDTIRRLTQREPNNLLDLIHGEISKRTNSAEMPVVTYRSATLDVVHGPQDIAESLPKTYEVEYCEDGTVRVKNVPIFGENKRTFPTPDGGRIELTYDRAWLEGAVHADAKLRDTDNYTPPMHFGHHERGLPRKRAGHFEQKSVKLCKVNGKPTWVTFADKVFSNKENFEKAKRDYPYRSIEISPDRPSEINSLALLSSEAPYFRFPNLAFAADTGSDSQIFIWSDSTMTDEEKKKAEADALAKAGETVQFAPPPMTPAAPPQAAAAPPPAAPAAPAPPPAPVAPQVSPTDQKLDQVISLLQTLIGALSGEEDDQPVVQAQATIDAQTPPVTATSPVVHAAAETVVTTTASDNATVTVTDTKFTAAVAEAPAAVTTSANTGDSTVTDSEKAKLEGELAGLKAKLAAFEKDAANATLLKTLVTEMQGYSVSPSFEADLQARIAKDGEAPARAYVAGIKTQAPKLPPVHATVADTTPAPASTSTDVPEVAKYAARGPEVLDKARYLSTVYNRIPEGSRGQFARSLGNYIDSHLEGVK